MTTGQLKERLSSFDDETVIKLIVDHEDDIYDINCVARDDNITYIIAKQQVT